MLENHFLMAQESFSRFIFYFIIEIFKNYNYIYIISICPCCRFFFHFAGSTSNYTYNVILKIHYKTLSFLIQVFSSSSSSSIAYKIYINVFIFNSTCCSSFSLHCCLFSHILQLSFYHWLQFNPLSAIIDIYLLKSSTIK